MKLSVVIPTFQRPEFLLKCVNHVLNNTLSPHEIIIVDDCSENKLDYQKVINKLQSKFPNIVYIRQPKTFGAPAARNKGAEVATGDYLLFCDDDDFWYDNHLSSVVLTIQDQCDVEFICSWTDIYEDGVITATNKVDVNIGYLDARILRNCFISSPSVCVKRELFLKLGGFDRAFVSCQDWDMWTRIILHKAVIACTNCVTTAHVVHSADRIGYSGSAWRGYVQYFRKHSFVMLKVNPILILFHVYYILFHYFKSLNKAKHLKSV